MTHDSPGSADISPPPAPRRPWKAEILWILAYIPLTIAFTWPLAARFNTELGGDYGDGWQNLWNIAWLSKALSSGQNPFYTHDLWHPEGVTLVFQTFDLPDAFWASFALHVLKPWATYNLVILWVFFSCGAFMYVLGRGTGASRPASFLSGCAYTFCTYHFGHALGHLHILAMQWVPLYVLALWKVLEGGRWRWAIGGGVLLACASLSSWYYLIGSFVISVCVLAAWLRQDRGQHLKERMGWAFRMCAVYLGLVAPLGISMVVVRATEEIAGSHVARFFSADLQSFVFPNAAQVLGSWSTRHRAWSGNGAENATYLGAVLVLLVLIGLFMKAPRVGAYVAAAITGIVLSLGPALHIGGHVVTRDFMPYALLENAFPLLNFMGVPVRFGFAATFGLAAALAPSLDAIARKTTWWAAFPLGALVLVEHIPHSYITSAFPTPAPMVEWAKDHSDFAVMDVCRDMRHLWHQTIHNHPVIGGYMTRTPRRLELMIEEDPILYALFQREPQQVTTQVAMKAVDTTFDRQFMPGLAPYNFSADITGRLRVTMPGKTQFTVESDDGAVLYIDGQPVVNNGGIHQPLKKSGEIDLPVGDHSLLIRYQQNGGGAVLRTWWKPPGEAERVLTESDSSNGLTANVRHESRAFPPGVTKEDAMARFHALNVRYVVQPQEESHTAMEAQLGLTAIYDGAGVRIFEIPPAKDAPAELVHP